MFNEPCPGLGDDHCTDCIAEKNEHCCWCGGPIAPEPTGLAEG